MRYTTASLLMLVVACGGGGAGTTPEAATANPEEPHGFDPPIVTNAQSPVAYPPDLFDQGIEGTVTLRLFVDGSGVVYPDSVIIVESSGHPGLDSAAVAGVANMVFAPARQDGRPVATTFLQPVYFSNPENLETEQLP